MLHSKTSKCIDYMRINMRGGNMWSPDALSVPQPSPAADPSALMLMMCQHFARFTHMGNQSDPRITFPKPRQPPSLPDAAAPEKLAVEVEEEEEGAGEKATPTAPSGGSGEALVGLTVGAAAAEIRQAVYNGKKRKKNGEEAPEQAKGPRRPAAAKGPRPKLPKPNDAVKYREASIISKDAQNKFRVFMSATVNGGFDVDRKWASSSRQAAFDSALDKVDSFWAS